MNPDVSSNSGAQITASAGLTDVQKNDLSSIWDAHTVGVVDENNRNQSSLSSIPLDGRSFSYVASLNSFLVNVVNDHADNRIEFFCKMCNKRKKNYSSCTGASEDDMNVVKVEEERKYKFPSTIDTIKCFFPKLFNDSYIQYQCQLHNRSNNNDRERQKQRLKSLITTPHIPSKFTDSNGRRRHILSVDHASFIKELELYSHSLRSFGSLLYHKPQHGLCVMNSAIVLFLITLLRRSSVSLLPSSSNMTGLYNRNNNHFSNIINTFVIYTRFHNVYPTIQIQHVKTSNAYKFITLKGRIIKVHSKRLRLYTADILCLKCGKQFEHFFYDGIYELPTRCRAAQQENSTGGNKACRGQKFELVRRTAKYIDYQKLKLQEEDHVLNTVPNSTSATNSSSLSSIMPNTATSNNSRTNSASPTAAAGRAPRSIDLEVTHDLVDLCHAGDCVKVVGIIHGMNTAVASGRGGKKAANETSTYTLYMVANSIVNTTADLHVSSSSKLPPSSMRGRGLVFTKDQLEKITKVAHAGKAKEKKYYFDYTFQFIAFLSASKYLLSEKITCGGRFQLGWHSHLIYL